MIKDISLLLTYFGIVGTIRDHFVKGSNIYNLYLQTKAAPIYKQEIGTLLHGDSWNGIVEYSTNSTKQSDYVDYANGVGEIIARCAKVLALPVRNHAYGAKKESVGRRTLEKYYHVFRTHENSKLVKDRVKIGCSLTGG